MRVPFRRNRGSKRRNTDWTEKARHIEDETADARTREQVVPKGDRSRQRTIKVFEADSRPSGQLPGVVVAVRGLFCDVDAGPRVLPCTVRRVLRTTLIAERGPIAVGDRVRFCIDPEANAASAEGVIEQVEPRRSVLRRVAGRRVHIIAANVDHAVVIASADLPPPRPHLIDRFIVAALDGETTPVVCFNKMDLDEAGLAAELAERYRSLGYTVLCTSAVTGEGVDEFRGLLKGGTSVLAGMSGVGKSSLLNAAEPGLGLKIGDVNEQLARGRHTTTTAVMLKLEIGGHVVDTPGIRTFDLSYIDRAQFEAYFVEFLPFIEHCKFPNCMHTHEIGCAVKDAVERGDILLERYESYVRLYEEPGLLE